MIIPLYSLAARLAQGLSLLPGNLGRSLHGRSEAAERWANWAQDHRRDSPALWIHSASVGEALVMEPIVTRLRRMMPDLQVVVTHSSPSLSGWPLPFADHVDFIPMDVHRPAVRFLDAVRPKALAVARRELWPVTMGLAADRIPVAIVGGQVHRTQGLRFLYEAILSRVSWVGAVSETDADAWARLGVPPDRLDVTGDPAHDRVLDRIPDLSALRPLTTWKAGRVVLVAGSVEKGDRLPFLSAARRVLAEDTRAGVLVIPHDPTPHTIARWLDTGRETGSETCTWHRGASVPGSARLLVIAETGLLSDIYALGDLAYVGGGFHRQTLHSVVEPAAYGLPILCGPDTAAQRHALALRRVGALHSLTRGTAGSDLVRHWRFYLDDAPRRLKDGLAGRGTIQAGAAAQSAAVLCSRLLEGETTG